MDDFPSRNGDWGYPYDSGNLHLSHLLMGIASISAPQLPWSWSSRNSYSWWIGGRSRLEELSSGIWMDTGDASGKLIWWMRKNKHLPILWPIRAEKQEVGPSAPIWVGEITIFNGKWNCKWQFSIAMLNYRRITPNSIIIFRIGCPFWG